jgi:nucleotide-binding universal stress UspA family protein
MPRSIIVPLDQSHVAECAIPFARALARQTGMPLTLLTVVQPPGSLPEPPVEDDLPAIEEPPRAGSGRPYSSSLPIGVNPGPSGFSESDFEEMDSAAREAEQYLEYVSNSITEAPVTSKVEYGDALDRIVRTARDSGADSVIVMASHGRSGIGRVLLGSVALSVAERAENPLFICRALRGPVASPSDIEIRRVLIALDGSKAAEEVIGTVRQLFSEQRVPLHLLSVVNMKRSFLTGEPEDRDAHGRSPRDHAEDYLTSMAERMQSHGFPTKWDVLEGDEAQSINDAANSVEADLIAMTTSGRSGSRRFAIGSVAERALHRATKPILLVRPK